MAQELQNPQQDDTSGDSTQEGSSELQSAGAPSQQQPIPQAAQPVQEEVQQAPLAEPENQDALPPEQDPAPSSTPAPVAEEEKKETVLESTVPEKKEGLLGRMRKKWSKHVEKNVKLSKREKQARAGEKVAPPTTEEGKKSDEYVPLSKQEVIELRKAEKIYQEGLIKIKDIIAPSSMEVQYNMMRLGETHVRSFYVYAYPRYIEANWLSPVVNFDVTMDVSMFIYPSESATILKILRNKVAQMHSSIAMNREKGKVRDPALETALEDAEELRNRLQRGEEKFFQFGLYFTIYSEDEDKLKKIATRLESILGGKLVLTKRADVQMEHAFNSCLPLCLDELEVTRNMNTNPLSTTFPFTSSELTSNEGILYGLNRHNDTLIIFDRFSLENANSVIFAKSGAGKSYAVKLEILRSMMIGTDVIVIDPENEYQELCNAVGGTFLKVSLNSDQRINPFDLPAALKDEQLKPGDLLRSNIINLMGLMKLMMGEITPEEEGILDQALIDTYSIKGITMDTENPETIPSPTMEDLYDVLSSTKGAESMAQRLQKFTTGSFSGIFNMPTNIDLKSGFVVFQIRDLEDLLRPIAMYIILNYIWTKVRSSLKKRLLIVDEAWSLMQHEDSAKFLYGLVKRARKYYLGISTITQDVDDFLQSSYGKPIVTNSSMQLLLKQSPSSIEHLGEVFNLTEGEKYLLLNSGVGQGLFFAGVKHVAIQIIASYTEDKIITTNPEELLKLKAQAEGEQQTTPEKEEEPPATT